MSRCRPSLLTPILFLAASAASASPAPAPPAYLPLPADAKLSSSEVRRYDAYEFEPTQGRNQVQRGKYWHLYLQFPTLPGNPDSKAIWRAMKSAIVAAGWTPTWDYAHGATLHYKKANVEAWAEVSVRNRDETNVYVVELGATPTRLELPPPAQTPEPVDPKHGDFPYLLPLPGARSIGGAHDDRPMTVTLPGSDKSETVSPGSITKNYMEPEGCSNLEFVTAYGDALARAGWNGISRSQSLHQADASVTAHYDRHGRNLWAYLHLGGGQYVIQVSDEGQPLAAALSRDCHVALYGVLFDFDKATLKPESDTVLARVATLLGKDASLKLEVQGHTDAVGDDAYNQSLSEARARSVVAWLTGHGVSGDRLTARGYGKTRPVADNRTDEGRAANRRVEIANPACRK